MTPDACVFCQIVAGEIAAGMVARTDEFIAFHDSSPRARTHVLVIPTEHHRDLDAFVQSGASSTDMLAFVHAVAEQLGIAGRYRLVTNVGPRAGQVIDHLHWHVLAGEKLPGFGV